MQRYDIFNKHNRVCIVNASFARFVSENERVMECDEKNVDSIDFARFFKEKCRENITIIVKSLTVKEVFAKAIEGLVFVQAAGGLVRNERGEYLRTLGFAEGTLGRWGGVGLYRSKRSGGGNGT